MELTIYRGTHEIGGNCVEICSGSSRIVLDIGIPLFDADGEPFNSRLLDGKSTEELLAAKILPAVPGVFAPGASPDAILLSHAHLDHTGFLGHTRRKIPVYSTKGTSKIMHAAGLMARGVELPKERFRELKPEQQVRIGAFRVTAFSVDHSVFGSVAFLIEADGKAHHCRENRWVEVSGAPQLNCRYVDHELAPSRTTGRAVYWDLSPARKGKTIDWLLVNSDADDRTPIIAEVKVGADKNPFFALIQTLMYAAELATPSQIERIRRQYCNVFRLPTNAAEDETASPFFDIYIVLHEYNQKRSENKTELLDLTTELARHLITLPALSTYIRRIAAIDIGIAEDNTVRMSKIFVCPEE